MALRKRWREGDYVRALDPPRLALVLSVKIGNAGKVRLLIDDALRDCDSDPDPEWVDAEPWEMVRRAAPAGELPDAA